MHRAALPAALLALAALLAAAALPAAPLAAPPDAPPPSVAYDNTFAKDFIMDAPWRVVGAATPIPIAIVLKDCDVDDIRQLHWIRAWDVTGGGSTLLWDHNFGDERIGDDATEANYWTYITTVTEGHPSLPNGTLLTPANLRYGAGDAIQIKVSVYYRDDLFNYTESRYLRVHVGSGPFPWPAGWYGGDTHVHSMYTNNVAEFGQPVPALRRAAAAIGLHWLTLTDHSCDLDETGDGTWSYATLQWEYTVQGPSGTETVARDNVALGGTWAAMGADATDFGGADLRLARAVEINLASVDADSPGKTLHALFVNPEYIDSPWCGTFGERPVFPTVPDGLAQLAPGGPVPGFAYAAHPLSDLGMEFGGTDFAVNGARWGNEDVAVAIGYEGFRGLEAFNTRPTRYSTNETNPWADFDAGVAPGDPYPNELLAGIAAWDSLLRAHIGSGPPGSVRKVFLAGGSDAHGDLNYSSYLSTDTYATDNALGKVQTVAFVQGPYGPGNVPPADAILAAYRAGRTVVTDGPFIEIGLDRDGDGDWYEAGDLAIGDAGYANPAGPALLRVRWGSLAEFGPIVSVKVLAEDAGATAVVLSIDPSAGGQGYSGATTLDLATLGLSGPRVLRAECLTSDGGSGHRAYTNPIWITFDAATEVAEDAGGEGDGVVGAGSAAGGADAGRLALGPVTPNPFHPSGARASATIAFDLPAPDRATLAVYDAAGRRVRTILRGAPLARGEHAASWDARDDSGAPLPAGIYFVALTGDRAGDGRVQKVLVVR